MDKIQKVLIFYCIFLLNCSAPKNIDYETFKGTKLKDDTLTNPYNLNNIIYTSEKQFIYTYYFLDSLGKRKYCKVAQNYHSSFTEGLRLGRFSTKDSSQLDKMRLYVFKGKSDEGDSFEQTHIKYNYYNLYKKKELLCTVTTVIEDESGIFLHPLRFLCFISNYLVAYPRVEYPLKIGKSWSASTRKLKQLNKLLTDYGYTNVPQFLEFSFTIDKKTRIKTSFKILDCYKIIGKETTGALPDNISTFYFNKEYGFVKQVYYDSIKKTTLVIELEDVIEPE